MCNFYSKRPTCDFLLRAGCAFTASDSAISVKNATTIQNEDDHHFYFYKYQNFSWNTVAPYMLKCNIFCATTKSYNWPQQSLSLFVTFVCCHSNDKRMKTVHIFVLHVCYYQANYFSNKICFFKRRPNAQPPVTALYGWQSSMVN